MAGLAAAVLIILADQGLKHWVVAHIELGESIPFIPGLLQLSRVHNYGAAFSVLQNQRWPLVVLMAALSLAIIILLNTRKIRPPVERWALVCVVGGAVGNGIDRLLTGYVVDMFDLTFIHFPVFNVSDIFIVCGGIVFAVHYALTGGGQEDRAPHGTN